MNEIQSAWVAGMVEGEGHIRVTKTKCPTPRTSITISSTDEDVIDKLVRVTECGNKQGPYRAKRNGSVIANWKPFWVWQLCRKDHFLSVAEAIRPHLCSRRSQALDEVVAVALREDEFAAMRRHHLRGRTHCKHGHEFTKENTRLARSKGSHYRVCKACCSSRLRKHRAKAA